MAAARKKHGRRSDPLIKRMDKFANELLNMAGGEKVTLAAKADLFRQVVGWIGVRNRIEDEGEPGGDLNAYRDRLSASNPAESDADRREKRLNPYAGNPADRARAASIGMARRLGRELIEGDGADLAAIQRRIPRADDGGADGNRGDLGDAPAGAARDGRGVRAGVVDGAGADHAQADRERGV